MSFNATNPVAVGNSTRKSHYDRVFNNTVHLRDRAASGLPMHWPGSDAGSLVGTAFPSGATRSVRAPGTSLLVLAGEIEVVFSVTLWADSGATATVALFESAAPNTAVTGSTLTSTNTDGERKASGTLTLPAGTYFIKGHAGHASLEARGESYVIAPA